MRLRPEIARQVLDIAAGVPTRAEVVDMAVAVSCEWWGLAAKWMCDRMVARVEEHEGLSKKDGP